MAGNYPEQYGELAQQMSQVEALEAELDRMLTSEVEGQAGEIIKNASAYHAIVVGRIQSDVEDYRALLPEYKRAPRLLIARLWQKTRQEILDSPGVTKFYRPRGVHQIRVKIPRAQWRTRRHLP